MGAAILWWLQLTALGWLAWPLAARIFRQAPGRGYAYARALGLLALALAQWAASLAGLLGNGPAAVRLTAGLLALGGLGLWLRDRRSLAAWLRGNLRHVLAAEALAAAAFGLYALQRAYDPAIAHTEQPMDMTMLAGILRSPRMPPNDPWLAGRHISYYYLGYQTVAMLCNLGGIPAGVGYNLGLAHTFALAALGTYGVLYDLLARDRRATALAAAGGLALVLAGNLVGPLEFLHHAGLGSDDLYRWAGVPGLAEAPRAGGLIPTEPWWWWRASRAFQDANFLGRSPTVITEFPAFSFVLGDLHPHVMALPYLLAAIGLAVALCRAAVLGDRRWWREPALWAAAPLVGALGFMNSWDLPTGLAVLAVAYGLGLARRGRGWWAAWAPPMALIAAGSVLLYLPFYSGLQTQVQGLGLVTYTKTRLPAYLLCFGVWLAPITLEALQGAVGRISWRRFLTLWAALLAAPWIATGLLGGWGRVLLSAVASLTHGPWLLLYLSGLLALLILRIGYARRLSPAERDDAQVLAHALAVLGLFLSYGVEFLYLRDLFDTRMNTVFKVYYQVWTLLALAGTVAGVRLWRGGRLGRAGAGLCGLLLVTCLAYAPAAAESKAGGYQGIPTLDGAAFLQEDSPGAYAAYRWLQQHAAPGAVLAEAPGEEYVASDSRLSAWTGIPSVLGWAGHEAQWRGNTEEVLRRQADLDRLYTTHDAAEAQAILARYGVRYVYIGARERERYGIDDARMQAFAAYLTPVLAEEDTVLFAVPVR